MLISFLVFGNVLGQGAFNSAKEQVSTLYHQQEYSKALALANDLLSQKSDIDLLITKSYIEEYLNLDIQAIQSLTDAIRISDQDLTLFFRRGTLAYRQGWFPQSIADLSRFISDPPQTTTAILYQLDESGGDQMKIRTSNSLLAEAYSIRGLAYQKRSNFEQARLDFENAIALESDVTYLVNLALLASELGDTTLAISKLKKGLQLAPGHSLTWYNLLLLDDSVSVPDSIYEQTDFYPMVVYRGVEALQEGNHSLAAQLIEPLLLLPNVKPEVYLHAGRISYGKAEYKKAITRYQEALRLGVKDPEIHLLLANSFFQDNSFAAAISEYELYLLAQSADASAWFNAAVAYHRLGDHDNMCRCIQRSVTLGMTHRQLAKMQDLCR